MTKTTDATKRASKLNHAALVLSKKRRSDKPHSNDGVAEALAAADMANPNPAQSESAQSVAISEMLTKRYGGISVYAAIMGLLAIAIVWTAVLTAEQVQQYHQDYTLLQKMKVEYRKLEIEHQRLIIEQQTFSATPQIASRAITELAMYSPTTADKLILQPAAAIAKEGLLESKQVPEPMTSTSTPTSTSATPAPALSPTPLASGEGHE